MDTPPRFPGHAPSPLASLGLSPTEEALYRLVLRSSGSSLRQISENFGSDPGRTSADLARLVAVGLVGIHDDIVTAEPPDEAIGRLISDETQRLRSVGEQLDALRGMLPSLMADHLAVRAPKGQPVTVETVEGENVVDLLRSLSATSTGDLMWLRPDQWRTPMGPEIDDWVEGLIASGRRSRAIYPARVLEEAPHVVRRRADAGEHVRLLASVPSRLAILGDSAALVPERWGENTGKRLVVRQHSLVNALRVLFDSLWERAMGVPGLDGQQHDELRAGDRTLLLDLLAGGAKDEQIARALGLSLRTVRRRVAAVLDELGVDSRFQAGVEAVRRGWI